MDIKQELENIEKLSNGLVRYVTAGVNTEFGSKTICIRVKKNIYKSVYFELEFEGNNKKIILRCKNPNDFGEPKKFEADYESSLLDTLQKKIIHEIEESMK